MNSQLYQLTTVMPPRPSSSLELTFFIFPLTWDFVQILIYNVQQRPSSSLPEKRVIKCPPPPSQYLDVVNLFSNYYSLFVKQRRGIVHWPALVGFWSVMAATTHVWTTELKQALLNGDRYHNPSLHFTIFI